MGGPRFAWVTGPLEMFEAGFGVNRRACSTRSQIEVAPPSNSDNATPKARPSGPISTRWQTSQPPLTPPPAVRPRM